MLTFLNWLLCRVKAHPITVKYGDGGECSCGYRMVWRNT